MLWNASAINGYAIVASDGKIGTISDFLFDDTSWFVRWLVADTGNWLSGRKVLLPSSALGRLDTKQGECSIKLTMQQIKDSPNIATDRPVSRQMEISAYGYYGYSPYWNSGYGYMGGIGHRRGYGYMGGMGGAMLIVPESRRREVEIADSQRDRDDVHLRSVEAVTGYHIHASDGEIGHVEDFIIEDADWSVRYLVVDTKNWWPGKKVLISPRSVKEIDWGNRLVSINVDRQKVEGGPAYDASVTINQAFDEKFLTYYGIKWVDA
jgi:sporulation protein YlmC with PRC-barrel domain